MPIQLTEVIQLSIELLARAEKAESRVLELEKELEVLKNTLTQRTNHAAQIKERDALHPS